MVKYPTMKTTATTVAAIVDEENDTRRARYAEYARQTLQDIRNQRTPHYPLDIRNGGENYESIAFFSEDIKHIAHPERRELTIEEYAEAMRLGKIQVTKEDTVEAAQRISNFISHKERVAILNMASSSQPGGGFLNGAAAQEESLCRRSTLITTIESFRELYSKDYYPPSLWQTSLRLPSFEKPCDRAKALRPHAIYSPRVTFFRTPEDSGFSYMPEPFVCDVISSPAYKLPKTGDTSTPLSDYLQRNTVVAAMLPRIQLLFHVAMYNGCEALVLGAWGCGAYGLDPHLVASMFKAYLCYDASIIGKDSRLQRIVFAIKTSADNHNVLKDNYSPFRTTFDDPGLLDLAAIIR